MAWIDSSTTILINRETPTSSALGSDSQLTSDSPRNSFCNPIRIAGVVVGGFVGAALIVCVVLWFRCRCARSVPSAPNVDPESGEKEPPPPPPRPLAEGTSKFHDPSDPSTYPRKEYLSVGEPSLSCTSSPHSNDRGYSGLPEVYWLWVYDSGSLKYIVDAERVMCGYSLVTRVTELCCRIRTYLMPLGRKGASWRKPQRKDNWAMPRKQSVARRLHLQ
ncbi:hypothetical protein H4582DRAFT_532881 [Lactarius indigo]|nr:hypothetical protein H4582DRAFT_532881 [Lactarius indigo]